MRTFLFFCSIICVISCKKTNDLAGIPIPTTTIDTIIVPPPGNVSDGTTSETTTGIFFTSRENDALGNLSTNLTCLNSDFSQRWKKTNLGNVGTPNCFYENGKIYLSVAYFQGGGTLPIISYSNLYCYNAQTGTLIWNRLTLPEIIETAAIRNDTVFASRKLNSVNSIAAFSGSNGSLIWNSPNTDQYGPYQMNLNGNSLYYASAQNLTAPIKFVSFNTINRNIQWQTSQSSIFISSISAPAFTNDKVGFTSGNSAGGSTFASINQSDGTVTWTKTANLGVPAVTSDKFFIVDNYQGVYALNSQNGNTVWQLSLGGQVYVMGQPYLSGLNLYVIAQSFIDNNVYLYSIKSPSGALNYRKNITTSHVNQQNVVVGKNVYSLNFINPTNGTTPSLNKLYAFDAVTGVPKDSTTITAMQIGLIGITGSDGKLVYSH